MAAGHDVVGMTRSRERARSLEQLGAEAAVADALDVAAVRRAVERARPQAVIDQLTDLPQRFGTRALTRIYRRQNELRRSGSTALLDGARAAGAETVIAQSVAFIYAPDGGGLKSEDDRVWRDAPAPFGEALAVAADHDAAVAGSSDFRGVVLRYGVFYGPDTHFAPGNGLYEDARRRRLPLVGDGAGVWSFIHVEDAADATVLALAGGPAGIYNVVDDDPAPYGDWVAFYAELLGAKPPRQVPRWLARLVAGPAIASWATDRPGASNAKAKRELDWRPLHPSWRDGLRKVVGGPVSDGRDD